MVQEKEKLASGFKRTIEQQRKHFRNYGKKFKEMEVKNQYSIMYKHKNVFQAKCKDLSSQKDKAVEANSTLGKVTFEFFF